MAHSMQTFQRERDLLKFLIQLLSDKNVRTYQAIVAAKCFATHRSIASKLQADKLVGSLYPMQVSESPIEDRT